MLSLQEPVVTWVKVEKPTFDLVGVVLGSFKLAGVMLAVAVLLGILGGVLFVLHRRRVPPVPPVERLSLHLDTHP
ncbi:MAG: hypothetical protein LJF30_04185 [Acidobacteria bacterium]|jgi:hypothetical protein|nr:hypothetical protein [Acidobacteriota bacterium]